MSGLDTLESRCGFFHEVIASWLADPDITITCGRWSDGSVSELLPRQRARLLPARYDGCFVGVRELRLDAEPHHLHIDLGRVHQACYAVTPSICLQMKPSFEVRFLTLGPGGAPGDRWAVSLMLTQPYDEAGLREDSVGRFFRRARLHSRMQPSLVDVWIDPEVRQSEQGRPLLALLQSMASLPGADWDTAVGAITQTKEKRPVVEASDPPCAPLLDAALKLPDASLVIYRDRTLVEFKTEKLGGLFRYEEHGHVSWQIGRAEDHHCHLSLSAVEKVLFSAEPVSCQGGGLNYTIWFTTPGPAGNPWRRDGYFSVTLNAPYRGTVPRTEIIEPLLDVYRRFRAEPWVSADAKFMEVLERGAPSRASVQATHHA
jgi:hypothetical protein